MDSLPAMVGYWGDDQRNRYANATYLGWFGLTPEEIKGLHIREMLGEDLYKACRPHIEAALDGHAQLFDCTHVMADGKRRHSQVSYIPDVRDGRVVGFFSLVTDVTVRKITELALAETQERMRVTLTSIGDALISTDCEGIITFMNPVAEEMTGWRLREAIGRPIEEVMDLRHADSGLAAVNPLRIALREGARVGMADNCELNCRLGGQFGVEDCASPIRDADGAIVGAVMVSRDVGQARAMAIKMTHLAQHDSLTDLPNRLLLHDRLHLAVIQAKRSRDRFALLFLDVDHFKEINDTLGHAVGDELIRSVARRISSTVRAGDTVSRQGGDEFLVLMPAINSAEGAKAFANRLMEIMRVPHLVEIDGKTESISITLSVGIAIYPDDADTPETLLRRADAAMYVAKRSGRNRAFLFSPDLDENIRPARPRGNKRARLMDRGVIGRLVKDSPAPDSISKGEPAGHSGQFADG